MMLWQSRCPRGKLDCSPLANIVADDHSSFICCGHSEPESRSVVTDPYRLCFYTGDTDSCYDHDETDLKDLLAIIADALAIGSRHPELIL
jgi:hypothetical protein